MANISTIKVGSTSYGLTPASHASTATTYGAATDSNYGHVKLSDNYTSSAGAAASGIGASSLAVCDAYNTLNSNKMRVLTSGTYTMKTYYIYDSYGPGVYVMKFPMIFLGGLGAGFMGGIQIGLVRVGGRSSVSFNIHIMGAYGASTSGSLSSAPTAGTISLSASEANGYATFTMTVPTTCYVLTPHQNLTGASS